MNSSNKIQVGARASPLSRTQVQEVLQELRHHHPQVEFDIHLLATSGDLDHKTSLRMLDKTDFFTKEIDELILTGVCRLGIHSAKDLPLPLPKGLIVICTTRGLDPADSLVFRSGESINTLQPGAVIATSSLRREEMVKQLRKDLTFKDIRGTIGERLIQLEKGDADGVVIAEAALIRLGLTHLNRIRLPGTTVEGQGRLAIVARKDDTEMRLLFRSMDKGNL